VPEAGKRWLTSSPRVGRIIRQGIFLPLLRCQFSTRQSLETLKACLMRHRYLGEGALPLVSPYPHHRMGRDLKVSKSTHKPRLD
jgi:hypothetical protein